MKKSIPIFLSLLAVILLSVILKSSIEIKQAGDQEIKKPENLEVEIHAVHVPKELTFAGEPVPVSIFDVKERLDRELLVNTYWHSNSLQFFKLAHRWFPLIENILAEEGIPDDFKYLALVESGLRDVISGKNAAGFWQFLKGTGKEYGLEINNNVDERYNIEKSTRAACKYLNKAYRDLGDWTLTAASYNMGRPRLKKLMQEQNVTSYYDLYLNDETSRYVFRIIAVKEIFAEPEKYGFHLNKEDLYKPIPYTTITINHNINDLSTFATELCTNYKTLKLLNPWLRQKNLQNPSRKTYNIKVPI